MSNFLSRLFFPDSKYAIGQLPWHVRDDEDYDSHMAGVSLTRESALAVATIYACVRVISYVISTFPVDTMRRRDGARVPIERPKWLDTPDPGNPNITRIMHFGQVVSSIEFEGNAFTLVLPSVFEPQAVRSLDPRRVEIRPRGVYRIRSESGGHEDLTADNIIHIPHPMFLGESQRAVSPVESLRQGMALSLAADRYGAKFYENGTMLSGVIKVKGPMSVEDQDATRDNWAKRYHGVKNAGKPGILTQDAEWQPLGVTPDQAQFIEQRRFQAEEMARAYGVPPSIVGITTPGAVSYASVEQQNRAFVDFTIRPLVESIEAAYQRLIPGPSTFMKFNMNALLRGDSGARADFYSKLLPLGALLPDEIRAKEDEPPIEGGNVPRVYLNTASASAADASQQANAYKTLVDGGYPADLAAKVAGLPAPPEPEPMPAAPTAAPMPMAPMMPPEPGA